MESSCRVSIGAIVAIYEVNASSPLVGEVVFVDAHGVWLATFNWERVDRSPWKPVLSCQEVLTTWHAIASIHQPRPGKVDEFLRMFEPDD